MELALAYDHRTSVITTMNYSALDFAANLRRTPVAFRGKVNEPVMLRQLMGALQEVILGDYRVSEPNWWTFDPVITVHPDQLFFEAFSTDESAYARLSAPLDAFQIETEINYGTTNIDFTFALRDSLQDLRSSRDTYFTVGAGGFGVQTQVGAVSKTHFERKVDLPDTWLKGFLQVQGALTMNAFQFNVRPADLLTVINYFLDNRARRPPHGMRVEFKPDAPISIVLEPWEERFTLQDTHYEGYPRMIRLWGRKRLELLLRVLPYAQKVTIGVLGRGLPHYYICRCGNYKFTLVLSGWVRNDWASGSAFDLLAAQNPITAEQSAAVYAHLTQHLTATHEEIEAHTLLDPKSAEVALFQLCRAGRAIYDPTTRHYRSRELFPEVLNIDDLFAPDPRIARAQTLADYTTLHSVMQSDTREKEWKTLAEVQDGDQLYNVLVAVDKHDLAIKFAQCECKFFRENIMSRGPCEHILATRFASEQMLQELTEAAIMVT